MSRSTAIIQEGEGTEVNKAAKAFSSNLPSDDQAFRPEELCYLSRGCDTFSCCLEILEYIAQSLLLGEHP